MIRRLISSTLFPYTTLFRSAVLDDGVGEQRPVVVLEIEPRVPRVRVQERILGRPDLERDIERVVPWPGGEDDESLRSAITSEIDVAGAADGDRGAAGRAVGRHLVGITTTGGHYEEKRGAGK